MPSVPELLQAVAEVRSSEVSRHVYAHQLGNSTGYVNASTEVHIKLDGIAECAENNDPSAVIFPVRKDFTYQQPYPVRDDELLEESPQHQLRAVREVLVSELMTFVKLSRKLVVAGDRSLHYLREERYEQCELREILVCPVFSSVYVYQVGRRLECVERDTQWYKDVSLEQSDAQNVEVISEVLEKYQDTEVYHQCEHQNALLPFGY